MSRICVHAYVIGRVQNVWFRQSTVEQAKSHGVTGWVRNLPDGRVEVMMYGEENAVRQLELWLEQGDELANVAAVESEQLEYDEVHAGFMIMG